MKVLFINMTANDEYEKKASSRENLEVRYRPKTISEVVGQPHITKIIEEWLRSPEPDIGHCIFSGPPGTGKTSTAIALAKDLFGKEWRVNLHEFNASNDRGIGFIRNEIMGLWRTQPVDTAFHIIFLDEADELTDSAQTTMRNLMEKNTSTTKFILSCNNLSKIIDPIQSRCTVFHFKPIPKDVILERMKVVCKKEHIICEEGALEILANASNGSLRTAIKNIAIYRDRKNCITLENVQDIAYNFEEYSIEKMLEVLFSGDTKKAYNQLGELYYDNELGAEFILMNILERINNMDIETPIKQAMINETGKYAWRIDSQSIDKFLQLKCYLNALAMVSVKK